MFNAIPLWVKIPYTVLVAVVIVAYWIMYGPANFLWFSDIAFFAMCWAMWRDSRIISSMMATAPAAKAQPEQAGPVA